MKPGLAKGTRDFSPIEIVRRRRITKILQNNFELFGFLPLETPSFENLSTLTGKYGEEGDRLIFKILNSGDFASKTDDEVWKAKNSSKLTPQLSDKALRYDLTVPFARYVAMNYGQLTFPYKRYQIQTVWRADRPQKGRYREFMQCDADVVGSESLWQEVELIQLYLKSFKELEVPVKIHINNRKILTGLAEYAGIADQIIDFTVALDKLDKIERAGVEKELLLKDISQDAISKLSFLFEKNSQEEMISILKDCFQEIEIGKEGIKELEFVLHNCKEIAIEEELIFDITLARGLDYYTGAILEVKSVGVAMGSVGGGGRYNDLTAVFGVKDMPGIGISFGLDRIYLVMAELNLFNDELKITTQYLFANYGDEEALEAQKIILRLREKNISAELYPDRNKMKKFFTYSEKKGVVNLVFFGEKEISNKEITIKNQKTGHQQTINIETFLNQI